MPQLVSRILLGALLPPLAVVFDVVCIVMIDEHFDDRSTFWWANLATAAFVTVYWCLLWWKLVAWTAWQVVLTIAALVPAWMVGIFTKDYVEEHTWVPLGITAGMMAATLLWMFATAFIWRQTARERLSRLGGG